MHSIFQRTTLRSSLRVAASSSARLESTRLYSSTMHDNDPLTLETEKRRNLSKTQHKTSTPHESAPGWNEHLASASEAHVKADKSSGSTSELQERTVKYVKSRHAESDENGSSSTTAFYSRDEVSGPLSGAQGKEEVLDSLGNEIESGKPNDDAALDLKRDRATESEENVKADRGEV